MTLYDQFKAVSANPVTWFVSTVSAAAVYLSGSLDVLYQLLEVTSTYWFPVVALAPRLEEQLAWLSSSQAQTVFIVGASLFVVVQLENLVDAVQKWRRNRGEES